METWRIKTDDVPIILRRFPNGEDPGDFSMRIPIDSEIAAIKAAQKNSVKAPQILGELAPNDDLGHGFFMQCINGEALPHKIFGDSKYTVAIGNLNRDCAAELAKIHSTDPSTLTHALKHYSPKDRLEEQEAIYRKYHGDSPIFELAFKTLYAMLPETSTAQLVHGDFRMGNLMIDANGIAGVLDWELSTLGDPVQDIGCLSTASWRFGHHEKQVGGFGDLDEFLDHYAHFSGARITREHAQFWIIYGSLAWGICCLEMIAIWRRGQDRSLEKTVIGRRFSETEVDILLLLEEHLQLSAEPVEWLDVKPQDAGFESTDAEILEALINWDTDNVIPNAQGHDLFKARVGRNALRILHREANYGALYRERQRQRLAALQLDSAALKRGLRDGQIKPDQDGLLTHLRLTIFERLSIDQPRYAGYLAARKRWLTN